MCIGCCLAGLGLSFVVVVVRRRRRRRQHQSPRTVNIKNAGFGLIYFATTNSFLENDVGKHACKKDNPILGEKPKQSNLGKQESPRGRRPHRPWATPPGFCDESLAPPWATPPAARNKFHYGHRPAPPDADGVHVRRCEALGRSSSPPPPSWEFCSKVELTNNARESALQTYDLELLPNQRKQ